MKQLVVIPSYQCTQNYIFIRYPLVHLAFENVPLANIGFKITIKQVQPYFSNNERKFLLKLTLNILLDAKVLRYSGHIFLGRSS